MAVCPLCRTEVHDEAIVCRGCGARKVPKLPWWFTLVFVLSCLPMFPGLFIIIEASGGKGGRSDPIEFVIGLIFFVPFIIVAIRWWFYQTHPTRFAWIPRMHG